MGVQLLRGFWLLALVLLTAVNANGQTGPLGVLDEEESPVKLSSRYHIESGKSTGFLIVKVEIPEGSHIYGMHQQKPLRPARITIEKSDQLAVGKVFKSDREPNVTENDPVFNTRIEEFSGTVQFYVPIKIAPSVDPKNLKPKVVFSGQVCSDEGYCTTVDNLAIHSTFSGYFQREANNQGTTGTLKK